MHAALVMSPVSRSAVHVIVFPHFVSYLFFLVLEYFFSWYHLCILISCLTMVTSLVMSDEYSMTSVLMSAKHCIRWCPWLRPYGCIFISCVRRSGNAIFEFIHWIGICFDMQMQCLLIFLCNQLERTRWWDLATDHFARLDNKRYT